MKIDVHDLRYFFENCSKTPKYIYVEPAFKRIRLAVYSDEFLQYIYDQLPFIISKDNSERFDATVILWKENDPKAPETICEYDPEAKTFYYGLKHLDYESVMKQGHILVHIFYQILKTDRSSLIHGAVIGCDGNGALLCGRGYRGKSTLTVTSMLNGMEYVSDDYLILEQSENGDVFASPIYSIMLLSFEMSDRLRNKLEGTRKLGLNAKKDKWVFNIENKHDLFRKHYPVRLLLYPEITDDEKPSVRKATNAEKGRAIVHLIHSTTTQMDDCDDPEVSKKFLRMVNQFDCYCISLSRDIEANSKLLADFMADRHNNL